MTIVVLPISEKRTIEHESRELGAHPAADTVRDAGKYDGVAMIDLGDIGMIFVRCHQGISHNPAEAVTAEDVESGARVLLRFIENCQTELR